MKNGFYQKAHRTVIKLMHGFAQPRHQSATGYDTAQSGNKSSESTTSAIASAIETENTPAPITNQGKYSHLKYGASDIGKTGCIPIAIYNVIVLRSIDGAADDRPLTSARLFDEILERVKSLRAPLFSGRMGTDPYMIHAILLNYGISSKEITDRSSLVKEMKEAEDGALFLITQWNNIRRPLRGIHSYVAEKHGDERWALYNRVYREYPTKAKDLNEMLGLGKLIVANRILP